jgi:alkylation response protein AidB-like acyl-CoA dehydrogenase
MTCKGFDLELLLTEEQTLLRDSAAKLFARVAGPAKLRALRASNSGFDGAGWSEIADAGFLTMLAPEGRGGLGLGAIELCLVMVEAGSALLSLPLAAAAVAAAESAAGAGRLVLPALDKIVPFAAEADGFLTADGVVARDGLSIAPLRLVDGSAAGELRPAPSPLSGRVRDLVALAQGAELVGVMERAFAIALDYLKTRVQFGKAIGSFQALQHRAVDEFMEVELSRSLVFQVAAAFDRGQGNPAMAAAVKARASAAALRVCKTALQFHGAMGYTDEHDIGLYLKRAMAIAAQFGNEAQSRRRFAALVGIDRA